VEWVAGHDRVDVAERELKNMYKMDEDATLTQLTTAWVHMALGGDKLQEAYYILQELAEKFGQTVQLLNGLAVYQMLAGKYEEAERLLNDALGKNNNDADTLANLVACSPHTGKSPELVKRYESQLTATSPHHGWVANMTAMSASFDRGAHATQSLPHAHALEIGHRRRTANLSTLYRVAIAACESM
jgi:coatomer protein complex subunit epsilon